MKKANYWTRVLPFLPIVILVVVTACSSPSSTTPTQSRNPGITNTETPSSSLANTPIGSVLPTDTMFAYFVSNGNLTIFATGIYEANLVAELQGKGPYTVFVPTDEAFLKLPPLQKNEIFQDKAKLRELMLYHFVKGEYSASELTPLTELETLQGETIKIGVNQVG
jgi:uncharacterized surface protein with fasciclin (FAS1) repeats